MQADNNRCPSCHAEKLHRYSDQIWSVGNTAYRLMQCNTCGSAFTFPPPDDALLQKLYLTSFDYRWYQEHYAAKLEDCRTRVEEYQGLLGHKVLDFGGGVGYLSRALREAGLESITFDPYFADKRQAQGVWDTVIALHVLEHSNNLDRTIQEIKSLLTRGGKLILAVPNFASLGYQQRGMSWVWAQPPFVHIHHFTAAGLSALLTKHGFSDLKIRYHERWDANLYCDLTHAEEFQRRDGLWGKPPIRFFAPLRRWIASKNSALRQEGLQRALRDYAPEKDIYAELEVSATLAA